MNPFTDYVFYIIVGLVIVAALIAMYFSKVGIRNFDTYIRKTVWIPPSWIFSFVWLLAYIMNMWFLYYFAKTSINGVSPVFNWTLIIVSLMLNVLWVYAFFNKWKIGSSLVIIVLYLALTIAEGVLLSIYTSKNAGSIVAIVFIWTFVAWLIFATYLNFQVYWRMKSVKDGIRQLASEGEEIPTNLSEFSKSD